MLFNHNFIFKGLLASGSKDNQQPVKIWEPKTGSVLTTLHAHKSTVMDVKWNANGKYVGRNKKNLFESFKS